MDGGAPNGRRPVRWNVLLAQGLAGAFAILLVIAALSVPGKDLFPLWAAGRGLLAGQNPYGPEVQAVIERDWDNDALFESAGLSYPLPMVLLLLPLAPLPYSVAKTALILLSLAGLVGTSRLMRLPWFAPLCFAPATFGALMAQVTPLWAALAVLLGYAIERRSPALIGLCVALLPAKPQSGLLLALAVYGWCLWRDRKALLWATALGALVWGGSVLLVPSWPADWLAQVSKYAGAIPGNVFVAYLPALPFILLLLWHGRGWYSRAVVLNYVLLPQVGGYSPGVLLPLLPSVRGWALWATLLSTCLLWLTIPIPGDAPLLTGLVLAPLGLGALLSARAFTLPPAPAPATHGD